MKPLVSILIPSLQRRALDCDTIRSALAQTWPRKEIIIVDDGSTRSDALSRPAICLREMYQWSRNQTRVRPQRETKAMSFARETTFSGWMRMIFSRRTRSRSRWQRHSEYQDKRTLLSSAWGYFMYRPSRAEFIANITLVRSIAS